MRLSIGTSGYSYKEWKGSFYPEKLPAKDMLAFYGERLPAVEINTTFYRLPKAAVLESWAAQVPGGFRFSLKASRRITHFKRLKETDDETRYFLETARTLGDRLGVLLFQLPPNLKMDLPRLEKFLELLDDPRHHVNLVVVVVPGQLNVYPVVTQQSTRMSGVLRKNDIGGRKYSEGSNSDVAQIADGSGHEMAHTAGKFDLRNDEIFQLLPPPEKEG